MKIVDVTIDGNFGNWGEVYSAGLRIWYEDENLRTGDMNVLVDDNGKVTISDETSISEIKFMELMRLLYRKSLEN